MSERNAFDELKEKLNGIKNGELVVLSASKSCGKSILQCPYMYYLTKRKYNTFFRG